jgi:ABC-type bacteriocin/lantibiotic exporter with double-glycine peptidase domain
LSTSSKLGIGMTDLYRAVWRVSAQRQLPVILLSLVVAGLAAAPLKFQQVIINHVTQGGSVSLLLWLGAGFLAVIALSAGLKFALNFQISVIGEATVLLIRHRLYGNAVHDRQIDGAPALGQGTLVTMLAAEAEAVGAFAGSAIASPLLQIGTLASVLAFIAWSQPWLGLFALSVVLPQAAIVVANQRRINQRVRERVTHLRAATDRIAKSDLLEIEASVITDFDAIYQARRRIFFLKLSTKFALSVISAGGTVGILLLGGLLVLRGEADIGTVVASVSGLARIEGPWREVVAFFRNASTVQVNYAMIVEALRPRQGAQT